MAESVEASDSALRQAQGPLSGFGASRWLSLTKPRAFTVAELDEALADPSSGSGTVVWIRRVTVAELDEAFARYGG